MQCYAVLCSAMQCYAVLWEVSYEQYTHSNHSTHLRTGNLGVWPGWPQLHCQQLKLFKKHVSTVRPPQVKGMNIIMWEFREFRS